MEQTTCPNEPVFNPNTWLEDLEAHQAICAACKAASERDLAEYRASRPAEPISEVEL